MAFERTPRTRPARALDFLDRRLSNRAAPLPLSAAALASRGLCLGLALAAASAAMAQPLPAPRAASSAPSMAHDIPAGALGAGLLRFAAATGVTLSFDPALTDGRATAGLRGSHTLSSGFSQLLAGSGLEAVPREGGGYTLRKAEHVQADTAAAAGNYTLREVRVTGKRDGETEGTDSYTTEAITIGKTAQALRELPQSVSVVTRQRLDDQKLTSLDEAAAQAVGITVQDTNSRLSAIYSRGFEIDSVQLDGGAPMFVGVGFYTGIVLDLAEYDRVELMRGAAGLVNGTGNPGGAVNLVRKMPTATPQLNVQLTAGRWNNYRTEVDASGPLAFDGKLRGRVVAAYVDRDYFTDRRATQKPLLYGVLEADLGPHAVLAVGARQEQTKERGSNTSVPRYSNGADLGLARNTGLTTDWAHFDSTSSQVFGKLTWRLADRWTLRANATHARQNSTGIGALGFGAVDPSTLHGHSWIGTPSTSSNQQTMLDVNISGAFELFGRTHEALFGADTQDMTSQWLGSVYSVNPPGLPIDIFSPNPSLWERPDMPNWVRDYHPNKQKQVGAYGSLRLEVADKTKLIVGARVNRFKYDQVYRERVDADDKFDYSAPWSLASATSYSEPTKVTPFAGLIHDINHEWSAYASYAEIYKPQANLKAGPKPGTGLAPMRGSNVELGLKGELLNGRLNTALALYRIVQKGKAIRDPRYESETILYAGSCCYLGSGKVISQGLDVEVNGEIARGLNVYAGYTYNNNQDKTVNAAFSTITPRHSLKLWTTWQLPDAASQWKIGGGATIQSTQYVKGTAASLNTRTGLYDGPSIPFNYSQSGYAVWNAMVEYRIDPKWSMALNLNNLFDKTYYRTVGSSASGNYYGEPRNVMVTLRGKF